MVICGLGLVCAVTPDRLFPGAFIVRFAHPLHREVEKTLSAEYGEVHAMDGDRFCVSLRPKSAPVLGDVFAQAAQVIAGVPALPDAPDGDAVLLLAADEESALIDALQTEYADLDDAAYSLDQFLLNVIARMRADSPVRAPF